MRAYLVLVVVTAVACGALTPLMRRLGLRARVFTPLRQRDVQVGERDQPAVPQRTGRQHGAAAVERDGLLLADPRGDVRGGGVRHPQKMPVGSASMMSSSGAGDPAFDSSG